MAEHHDINLLKTPFDLDLGAAEVIKRVEQKTRNRQQKNDYYPDELKYTVVVSGIDTESNDQRYNSETDIQSRENTSEIISKNGKTDYLRNNKETEDNYSSDTVLDRSLAFYRSFLSHYPIFSMNALYPR
jgi:hypothetical protein